ncbi:hypothetical protein JM18_003971 [Phytophthora kernoviae]|uniref:TIR domain-containing protein n=1 Tax=Phytophthora kernoviae TaxID=325452 RepID=A0A922APD3_9STRA|nr:hypothetical protein JM18_003971 [Phytophthora kernoviae]
MSSTSSNAEPSAVVAPSSSLNDIVKEHQRYEKTYIFTLCELIVVLEIPYLIYILICIFLPSSNSGSVVDMLTACDHAAVGIAGPDFATAWYTPRTWKIGGMILIARGQRNPLHVAVAFDQIEVVRELLANGHFDVHQFDNVGVTGSASVGGGGGSGSIAPGLASASHPFGPVGLLQATLLTPLHVAVTLGHTELTLLLLRYGAKPDEPALSTHPRFTTAPLYWAVDKESTRLLLDAGANPLALPMPGGSSGLLLTAFEVARIAGNAAVARQMEKYGGDVALTPLHDACAGGRRQEVTFLLDHGADPNTLGEQVVGCFRRTPLHWAAMRGHARIMRTLLRYGASVESRDIFGRTPLAWACVLNRAHAVETLLESGADVDVRDAQGDPLLCICAAGACASIKRGAKTFAGKRDKLGDDHVQDDENDIAGDEDGGIGDMLSGRRSLARGLDPRIFQMLLDHGVDLQATRASNGDSALHVALRRRNQAAAVLFVRAGLSLTAVNLLGQRAIDCARSPALRFAVKKEAGQRDVMISYSHAHTPLACKLRDALERARVTTWIDSMGPTGITGGSVWRQEIARGIQSSALVLAVLTKDYPQSQWCMKELAFAKMQNVPVVAIQCEDMEISEELQVYLWTRQVIDFRPAIKQHYAINTIPSIPYSPSDSRNDTDDDARADSRTASNSSHTMIDTDSREGETGEVDAISNMAGKRIASSLELVPDYNDDAFRHCLRMLLDGIQDQIEEHRARLARRQEQQQQQSLLPGGEAGGNTAVDNDRVRSRRESRGNVSECTPEENDKACAAAEQSECEDQPAQINFPEGPLNMPLFRPLRRIESLASSLAFASLADTDAYIFIAHGDFHHSFCLRLQKALLKQNIRCVVDQTVPAVQYAHQSESAASTDGIQVQSDGFDAAFRGVNQPVTRLPVQTRQLAAKDAILSCSAVLVVLSPLSANCDLLADQLAFAEDRGKLLVPVLLSLHNVDLAKRYTFSRSLVHHFNTSLGFEQSVEQLSNYLRVQQQSEARQRRLERRQQDQGDFSARSGPIAVLSPISSVSSAESRLSSLAAYTDVIEVQSPFDDVLLNSTDSSLLLPTLPAHIPALEATAGANPMSLIVMTHKYSSRAISILKALATSTTGHEPSQMPPLRALAAGGVEAEKAAAI